ncbi:MAG: PH domain-containing protein [Cohaesibacter sp.]|nr:PH domain-containing protein [Cohaesibacter sp.]
MIIKMAKLLPAFTKKGNAKNVETAKAEYEQLGWVVTEEFIGSFSNPSYLIVEGEEELKHPKRSIVDKVEDPDDELHRKNMRLTEIQKQIDQLGIRDTTGVKKEIRSLPDILEEDEVILGLVAGLTNGNSWLAIVTQYRVVMIDVGLLVRFQRKEVQLKDIKSIETKAGLLSGTIEIKSNAVTLQIEKAFPADGVKFIAAVKEAVAKAQKPDRDIAEGPSAFETDITAQLSKLGELKAAGILSEEEFTKAKSKILGNP